MSVLRAALQHVPKRTFASSTIKIRGIPRDCKTNELVEFFDNRLPADRFYMQVYPSSKAGKEILTGFAEIEVKNDEEMQIVKGKHMANLRHRYIEVLD